MMNRRPNVAIYVRVSSAEQERDGLSKEAQPANAIKKLDQVFGKGQYGYEIFEDLGKSGSLGPNPHQTERKSRDRIGFWNMLVKIRSKEFTHICAFRGDRLYRNVGAYLTFYNDVMKPLEMDFIFVGEEWDRSIAGQLTASMLAVIADHQRKQTSENVAHTLTHKRNLGYNLGTTPFGWRRESEAEKTNERRNIVPVPSERDVVIRIKDMYLSGMSEQGIAVVLNRERVPHKKSVGHWLGNTVNLVLCSPAHAGLIRKNKEGDLSPGLHQEHRLYDEGIFMQIQERMSRNRKRLKGVSHSQPFRLFSGLAYCGCCKKTLQSSFYSDSPAYRCLGNRYTNDGTHVYINAKHLEDVIVNLLSSVSQKAEYKQLAEREIERLILSQDNIFLARARQIKKSLEGIEQQKANLIEAISNKIIRNEDAKSKLSALNIEADALVAESIEVEKQLSSSDSRVEALRAAKIKLDNFLFLWDEWKDHEKREALHSVIERIDVCVEDDRKFLRVKLITESESIEIELLRGAERYKPKKTDGPAALSVRELAALKHILDGANYASIAKYFNTTVSNTHCLLSRAKDKTGSKTFLEAAQKAEATIRRIESQLPLFGKYGYPRRSDKRLTVMEYQVLEMAAQGCKNETVAARTGLHTERIDELLLRSFAKTKVDSAREAMKIVRAKPTLMPKAMENRSRTE